MTDAQRVDVDMPHLGIDTANHAGIRVRGYTVEQVRALLLQVAEQAAEIAELRSQKADWAWDASIAADDKAQRRTITELYRAAERAREAACGLLRECVELSDNWPGIAYADELESRIAAFLAANGGGRED